MSARNLRLLTAVATVAVLATAGCSAGTSKAAGDPTNVLRIAGNANASALPLWVALDKGMLKKHGLSATFTSIANVATLPPALGKSFDIIFTTPTLAIASTSQGIPVTEIAGSSIDNKANPSSYLMVMKDSNITSVKDLKGKKIGVLNETGTLHIATRYWLQKESVSPDSVSVLQVDGAAQADQLKAGRVDAVETVKPFSAQIEAVGGKSIGTPYFALADAISPIYWGAQRSWAEKNPKVVKSFQEALTEAIEYIKTNDKESRAVLQKYSHFPAKVVASFELPTYDAKVRPEDVDKWLTAMRESTGFKGQVDVSKLTFQP
jgi:NitT/TauT family transport system substrate-binding protein